MALARDMTLVALLAGALATFSQGRAVAQRPAACGHEPPGMQEITSQPWDRVPAARQPGTDLGKWRVTRGPARLTVDSDNSAPLSPPSVLRGLFPKGMRGGVGPFHVSIPFKPVRTLYQCFALKLSPGFTNNGNVATKLAFILNPHSSRDHSSQAYLTLSRGQNDRGSMGVMIEAPHVGGRFNRNMLSHFTWGRATDRWHVVEVLMTANTANLRDGSVQFWVDGKFDFGHSDVAWFVPGADPVGFNVVDITPTYGGGHNKVPSDQYIYIDHWYLSGRN